jgi:hypothetical protein
MPQFDHVSVVKKANIYFDGKCVSHTVVMDDGSRKSLGVIFPSRLTFSTAAPEVMDVLEGSCLVTLPGAETQRFSAGESFSVPGNSAFDIEVTETLHYVCHYG